MREVMDYILILYRQYNDINLKLSIHYGNIGLSAAVVVRIS